MKVNEIKGLRMSFLLFALLILGLAQAGSAFAAERITATIVDPGAAPRSSTVPVSIYIYEYSSAEEVQRLADILTKEGSQALREALWDLEKGWIRIGNSLGYPIAVALSQPGEDGGRHITMFGDRPISFFEIWNSTRSADYPFSVLDIRVGKDGTGSGEMIPAAKVRLAGGKILTESYAFQPAKLLGVRVR